jgi:hypothetical protein
MKHLISLFLILPLFGCAALKEAATTVPAEAAWDLATPVATRVVEMGVGDPAYSVPIGEAYHLLELAGHWTEPLPLGGSVAAEVYSVATAHDELVLAGDYSAIEQTVWLRSSRMLRELFEVGEFSKAVQEAE